ncbi:MAG: DNA-directed RNA polymerase [Candidatus Micrarchaeia archaeon]
MPAIFLGGVSLYRILTVKDTVRVPPAYFAMSLPQAVTQLLREKYERKVDKDHGIVLSIWNVRDISEGRVIPGDGAAYHDVTFDALVYAPEVNEVFEGEVTEVVEFGAFVRMGPLDGLVHLSQITNDFLHYDKKIPAFIGKESKKTLRKGDIVRAKVSTVSLRGSIPESKVGLTMRPEGLGKLEWLAEKEEKPKKKKE